MIREALELVLRELIEAAAAASWAGRYERAHSRTTARNSHRGRLLATQAGDLELKIPKLRKGSSMPSVLEPRRRTDRALHAAIVEACVAAVSTRSVGDPLAAPAAAPGISKSEVSRVCAGLDEGVEAFRSRAPAPRRVPLRLLGRRLPQCAQQRVPAGVDGHGGGHRGHLRAQP